MTLSPELKQQIEAAFDYRGHVTVELVQGSPIEGYLCNRQYSNPKLKQDNFVDVIIKNKDEKRRIPIAEIRSIALTGEDCAAGKSYEEYVAKQQAQNKQ